MTTRLTPDLAAHFARLALSHVEREYPHKLDHVLDGDADARGPRALHPLFFGSFDWHSCVHGYWLLATVRRLYPHAAVADDIGSLFARRVTADAVTAELAYLARPSSRGFERPYGWAWALMLQAELERHEDGELAQAAVTLRPLAHAFAKRLATFLPLCDYPIRSGTHASTAFALRLAADYAEPHDPALFTLIRAKALAWYGDDRDCQAWEPSQDDFLSPALMEAECMRRVLGAGAFRAWFAAFLPRAGDGEPSTLFAPVRVSDRSDGKIAHLDGLHFARAWCWRGIAASLADGEPAIACAQDAAERHIAASLPHVAGDYMGEHWLATFALLALLAG